MNLSDHFEPMPPPSDGLKQVHRIARRRAVMNHTAKAGGVLTALLLVASVPLLSSRSYDANVAATDQQSVPSLQGAPPNVSGAPLGPPQEAAPAAPQNNSAPSSALPTGMVVCGLLLVVATAIVTLRRKSPALRIGKAERISYLLGSSLVILGSFWWWQLS